MKHFIAIVLFSAACNLFGSGAAGLSNVNIISDTAPQTAMRHVEAAIDRAQQITSAMETLLTLNQSLQYQIQAAQALSEGSWDSFVEFFNYETAAIAGYNETIANLNSIVPFAGDDFFAGSSYQTLVTHSDNMKRSMVAANNMVRSTDSLVKQTEANARLIQTGIRDAANAPNPLQALQGQAKIMAAIASESRASTQLLYSQGRYLQTLFENSQRVEELNSRLYREAMKVPGPYDDHNAYRRAPESDRIRESLAGKYINGSDRFQF